MVAIISLPIAGRRGSVLVRGGTVAIVPVIRSPRATARPEPARPYRGRPSPRRSRPDGLQPMATGGGNLARTTPHSGRLTPQSEVSGASCHRSVTRGSLPDQVCLPSAWRNSWPGSCCTAPTGLNGSTAMVAAPPDMSRSCRRLPHAGSHPQDRSRCHRRARRIAPGLRPYHRTRRFGSMHRSCSFSAICPITLYMLLFLIGTLVAGPLGSYGITGVPALALMLSAAVGGATLTSRSIEFPRGRLDWRMGAPGELRRLAGACSWPGIRV
jgi:hypothetical protein